MDKTIVNRFYSLSELMRKFALNNYHVGGVSKSEFFMLQFIKISNIGIDVVTTADLSERLHISKPAVSQMINVLEKKQYVMREIHKDDRRLISISLTDLGNQVLDEEKDRFLNKINTALDIMGKEDSEVFIDLMERYFKIVMNINKCNS